MPWRYDTERGCPAVHRISRLRRRHQGRPFTRRQSELKPGLYMVLHLRTRWCKGNKLPDRIPALGFRQHTIKRVQLQGLRLNSGDQEIDPGIGFARIAHPAAGEHTAFNRQRCFHGAKGCCFAECAMTSGRHRFRQLKIAHGRLCFPRLAAEPGNEMIAQIRQFSRVGRPPCIERPRFAACFYPPYGETPWSGQHKGTFLRCFRGRHRTDEKAILAAVVRGVEWLCVKSANSLIADQHRGGDLSALAVQEGFDNSGLADTCNTVGDRWRIVYGMKQLFREPQKASGARQTEHSRPGIQDRRDKNRAGVLGQSVRECERVCSNCALFRCACQISARADRPGGQFELQRNRILQAKRPDNPGSSIKQCQPDACKG